jgi:plexin A
VEIEAAKFRIPARLEAGGSRVVCDRTTYRYESAVSEYNASISVLWNTDNILDRTNITLYKCSLVGSYRGHSDCSLCMTRTSDLGCVWCGTGCQFTSDCPVGQSDVCPLPRIEVVRPLSGPIDGGTTIQIEGSNLAMGLNQLRGRVLLGGNLCHVTAAQVSVRIECTTAAVSRESDLPVRLRTDNGIIESVVKFRYRDVGVTSVTPRFGPMSGGTVIAVEGTNLNIGSSLLIYLDSIPCLVNPAQVTSSRVTCTTGPAPHPMAVRSLVVIIDDARRSLGNPYTYTPDPTIVDVRPKWSFVSGGRILTVHGKHLNTVEQPFIAALDDRGQGVGRSACVVVSSTQMDCPSPAVMAAAAQLIGSHGGNDPGATARGGDGSGRGSSDIQSFKIGFEMDQVRALLDLAQSGVNAELLYVEDPVYFKFPHNEKSYKGDAPLVIEGSNLNLAADETDLDVRIGTERCNVTSLTATQMLCVPPQTAPPPAGHHAAASDYPEVVVYVGKNLKFEIGRLRYDLDGAGGPFSIPPEVIGGIGAAAALTLFIAIAFMIVYKHKSSQAEREYKRIQIQMDTLENNVRSECKQAFAELQTDMTDLTMDLEMSGIPLLDHRTFVTKAGPGFYMLPPLTVLKSSLKHCQI